VAKTPVLEFQHLIALSDAVVHASINDGPPFVVRPGTNKDRSTPPETLLWRYLPKCYFFDLLETRSQFFTRLTFHHAVDPFEGALPYAISALQESIVRERGGDVAEFVQMRETFVKKFLRVVLVNSWHERPYENRSMWDRYGGGKEAVALVTTFQRLCDSVPARVDVGHVDYVDVGNDEIGALTSNPSQRAFQKVRELDDEREVRGVIFDSPVNAPKPDEEIAIEPGTEIGYRVPVDIDRLVQRVVVSPSTPHILDEVRSRVRNANLNVEVAPSTLSRRPTY
jgi:hypothetical protein